MLTAVIPVGNRSLPFKASDIDSRPKPRVVKEKAKMRTVTININHGRFLRVVQPSSEKICHRRQRRNVVNCTPVTKACITKATIAASASDPIVPSFSAWYGLY